MNGTAAAHDRHDRHLVAALAADDLEPLARADAETLVASCRECADLLADLRAIALATAALPAVPRTREFRLTAADAARLRPSGWRAVLEALVGARSAFSRPLAVGLTTIGLVGVLATTIPSFLGGGFGSAASGQNAARDGAGLPAAAAAGPSQGDTSSAGAVPLSQPSAAASALASAGGVTVDLGSTPVAGYQSVQAAATARPEAGGNFGPAAPGSKGRGSGVGATATSGATTESGAGNGAPYAADTSPAGGSPLLLASAVCLVVGLVLFLARWSARRLARR